MKYIIQIGMMIESDQDLRQIEEVDMDTRKKLVGHFIGMLRDIAEVDEGEFHLWGIDLEIDEVEDDVVH